MLWNPSRVLVEAQIIYRHLLSIQPVTRTPATSRSSLITGSRDARRISLWLQFAWFTQIIGIVY